MTLLSLNFFLMLAVSLILYYATKKKQKYILLFTSFFFFCCISKGKVFYMLSILLGITLVTYLGGITIQKLKGTKRTFAVTLSVILLASILFLFKYAYNLGNEVLKIFKSSTDISFLQLAAPVGISYFTLSAIGYLFDVYWKTYDAEKNIADIALFVSYFPAITSGPVLRFKDFKNQLDISHSLKYENFDYGLRRMLWGYFKKAVISERFAIVVKTVFDNYATFSGYEICFALICYAFQLYTDFSGCMDIIIGASKLFDFSLPENFNAPFLARTIPDFWRRWHISLGNWFKDYVMYPILKTETFQRIGQWANKTFGKKYGKKIPTLLSTFVLWFLIGIWHGGVAYYFMASAFIPCLLLTMSSLFEPLADWFGAKVKINKNCFSFVLFQRIRTMFLMLLVWLFVCSHSISRGFSIIKHSFMTLSLSYLKNISLAKFNISIKTLLTMIGSLAVLYLADYLKEQKTSIYDALNQQNKIFKICILYAEVLTIALFGHIGISQFIYFQF